VQRCCVHGWWMHAVGLSCRAKCMRRLVISRSTHFAGMLQSLADEGVIGSLRCATFTSVMCPAFDTNLESPGAGFTRQRLILHGG
jgi:hypothetical protein